MTYDIVSEQPDSFPLVAAPSALWVISTLEIAINQGGEPHLLLIFPSYAISDDPAAASHDEGYWAPPFVAYPVPIKFSPPTTAGSLRRSLDRGINRTNMVADLDRLAYLMGLRDTEFEYRGSFTELKTSPRFPELVKAYKIVRHGLINSDQASVRNLADPDSRRGHIFYPLDSSEEYTTNRYSKPHARMERWFLGKPLMSNVEYLLSDKGRRQQISHSAIPLQRKVFSRQETGLLCAVDLAGYGTTLRYAGSAMHAFDRTSTDIQDTFRKSVTERFDKMLVQLGVMQVQTAGDGFIAGFPRRVFDDVNELLRAVLQRWHALVAEMQSMNAVIRDANYHFGSRMALHYGAYEWGRIGGIRSFAPAFDGASVIEVSRLEQGLSLAMKSGGMVNQHKLTKAGNYVLLSQSAHAQAAYPTIDPVELGFRDLGLLDISAKEYSAHTTVLECALDRQMAP